jgi:ferredoxin
MSDAYIRFTREGLSGTVAVGSYLADVMRRFGVHLDAECDRTTDDHQCEVSVMSGGDLLSDLTSVESEHFKNQGRTNDRRLACEARITKPGEIEIMTNEKDQAAAAEDKEAKDRIQEDFAALPLEKKIANLLKMEVTTLGETVSYVVNSPMKVVEKVGDVIAEFGMKLEAEAKKASRPKEHTPPPPVAETETADAGSGSKRAGRSQKT